MDMQELGSIEEIPGKAYMEEGEIVSFTCYFYLGDREIPMKWRVEKAENYFSDRDRNFIFENIRIKKTITDKKTLRKHVKSLMKELHFYWRNRNKQWMNPSCRPFKALKIFLERPENVVIVRPYDAGEKYEI